MEQLIQAAKEARENAYAPYSNFKVGAAVLGENGEIYSGCNIENASFGLSICAERTAIFKAVSQGVRQFKAIAIIADTDRAVAPCGACRQVIAEFGISKIIMCSIKGHQYVLTLNELLPYFFHKSDFVGDEDDAGTKTI